MKIFTPLRAGLTALMLNITLLHAQSPNAWWPAEGNALDSAGTNNGTIISDFSYVPGENGEAFSFAGGTVVIPDATDLDPSTNLTVQIWVKASIQNPYAYVLAKNGAPAGASYAFYTGGNLGLSFWIDVPGDTGESGLIISPAVDPSIIWDGQWHQAVGTYDGTAVHLYVDGSEVGGGTAYVGGGVGGPAISYTNAGPLVLGSFPPAGSATENWSGGLDDIKVFDRALAASEVMDIFTNAGSPSATNGLASWWKADGDATDSWGNNPGTVNSATVTFGPGKIGEGFLSAGGAVLIPDSPLLEPQNLTVQAWVKSTSPGAYKYVLSKSRVPTYASYALYTGGSGGMTFFASIGAPGNGTLTLSPSADPSLVWDGAWHQVTGVYDGSALHLYVDGIEAGSGTAAAGGIDYTNNTALHNGAFVIGNDPTFVASMSGGIDEVKVWDEALTDQQVMDTFKAGQLISWWRAEGDATDSAGTNNGALDGNVTFGAGRLTGTAFKFDGGAVDVPGSSSLEPQQITVEAVVSGSPQGTNKYILSKAFSGSSASYALWTGSSGGLNFYVNVNGSVVVSPSVSPASIWDGNYHSVAGTYDGQNVRFYLDGNEVGSGTPATGVVSYGTAQSGGDLLLGDFSSSLTTSNFVGLMDNVKIYNTALSAQGILNDAFQPAMITSQPSNVQAAPGSKISLSVSALPSNVTYQWTFDGTNIAGATQSVLTLSNLQAAASGSYQVAVMVGAGDFYVTNSLLGGEAFHLPGVMVDVPNDPSLEPANQVTVQAWVRDAVSPGDYKYIITKSLTAGAGSYAFWTGGGGGVEFYDYLTSGSLWFSPDAGPGVWDGNWHQLTGMYDGEFTKIYLDGVQVGSGTDGVAQGVPINYGGATVNGDFIIGDFVTTGGNNYGGDIDEVKVFNYALSDAEVMDTYTNLNGTSGMNGLISWWRAEGNTLDSFGQNNGHFLPLPGTILSDVAVLTVGSPGVSFTNVGVSAGIFTATVTGTGDQTVVVERTSGLINPSWTPVTTNTTPFQFTDPIGGGNMFYRAVSQ
ncbi:MAG TPA: LamG-like jellyroll fold domain-containing protein [Verrucomicrobiae bacterium]|jgi:hypothetical protein|nr:LamG-like jellyroll fold domain-containing protein [Verrucomicrobiae bacterium]